MAGQLTEFLASINRLGVAKTSHFRFSIDATIPGTTFSDIQKVVGLRCETAELPGRQFVSNDSRIYGPIYKTPHQSLYQEITVTFVETADFLIRGFFEKWMDAIYNSDTNILGYPNQTRFDSTITQYDVMLNDAKDPASSLRKIAEWTLIYSFPTAINQMPVAWSEDGLHRVTVTMAYEWYFLATSVDPVPVGASNLKSPAVPPKGSSGGIFNSFNPFK